KEIDQRIDHGLPYPFDVVEVAIGLAVLAARHRGRHGRAEHFQRAQRLGEITCRRLADVADAERVNETIERNLAARLDGLEQVLDRLSAVTLLCRQPLVLGEARVAPLKRED